MILISAEGLAAANVPSAFSARMRCGRGEDCSLPNDFTISCSSQNRTSLRSGCQNGIVSSSVAAENRLIVGGVESVPATSREPDAFELQRHRRDLDVILR